jgi:hypothetical protein
MPFAQHWAWRKNDGFVVETLVRAAGALDGGPFEGSSLASGPGRLSSATLHVLLKSFCSFFDLILLPNLIRFGSKL